MLYRTEERVMRNKKGFTLIEMLVVIAIIAVLISIIIPTISNATQKAKAATDAANLRTVLGLLNTHVVNGQMTVQEIIDSSPNPASKMDPDAKLNAVFETPGFVDVFYINGSTCYSLEYLSELAANGPDSAKLTEIGTTKPTIEGGTWYVVSGG